MSKKDTKMNCCPFQDSSELTSYHCIITRRKLKRLKKKKSTSLLGSIKEKKTEQTAGPKNGETGKYRESQLTEQRPLKHKWLQESEPGRKT